MYKYRDVQNYTSGEFDQSRMERRVWYTTSECVYNAQEGMMMMIGGVSVV